MAGRDGRVSRDMLAFQSLLERDDELDSSPPGHRNPSRKASAKRAQQRRNKAATTSVPGFKLRDAHHYSASIIAGGGVAGAPPGEDALAEMFPHVEHVILAEVYAACGHSVDAAADALLAMNLGGGGSGGSGGSSGEGSSHDSDGLSQPGADWKWNP